MTRRDLVCVLVGMILMCGAFGIRDAVRREALLEQRVDRIEQFLVAATRGGGQ